MQIVRPAPEYLESYGDALRRGWSPDNMRGAAAAREELDAIARDAEAFLQLFDNEQARGGPVELPDGSKAERLPSIRRWMWGDEGFIGTIGLRWPRDLGPLPPHVLGHIGYAVVPWARGRGHATAALRWAVAEAHARGLAQVDVTTDRDNLASQRVIQKAGGVLLEAFDKPAAYGGAPSLRYRIATAAAA